MSALREKLTEILRRGTQQAQVGLYHWELSRGGPRAKLVVYIDTPSGVTLADCERTSRAIEALLDEEDPLAYPYVLEVSSPGVERRLWEPDHYRKALGKRVKVVLRTPRERKTVLIGKLSRVTEQGIEVAEGDASYTVGFSEISRAQLVYEPEGDAV